MPYLDWIDDSKLEDAVGKLHQETSRAGKNAGKALSKNVIDPFAAYFEMEGFGIGYETWLKNEAARQAQKTMQNHLGDFHQNILGSVKEWDNLNKGREVDLESKSHKIIAEIKNKYNTVSGGKLSDFYYSLNNLVSPKSSIYKGYTAYFVAIIPKKPVRYNKTFKPSDKSKGEKCPANELIRETDGASFYELVTKESKALEQLFDVLPKVVSVIVGKKVNSPIELKKFFIAAFGN